MATSEFSVGRLALFATSEIAEFSIKPELEVGGGFSVTSEVAEKFIKRKFRDVLRPHGIPSPIKPAHYHEIRNLGTQSSLLAGTPGAERIALNRSSPYASLVRRNVSSSKTVRRW